MSMISSLIDELRKSADEWNGSNMFELARMCSDAADTIWQLRDDLQRANAAVQEAEHDESMAWDRVRKAEAENAKLRVERDEWHRVAASKQDIIDHMRNANSENAKLRELVRDMFNGMCGYEHDCRCCEHFEMCEGQYFVGECEYNRRMRELGAEVDG